MWSICFALNRRIAWTVSPLLQNRSARAVQALSLPRQGAWLGAFFFRGLREHSTSGVAGVRGGPGRQVITLLEKDLEERFVRGSGNGGQKVNKTSNCVDLLHVPTNTRVKVRGRERR